MLLADYPQSSLSTKYENGWDLGRVLMDMLSEEYDRGRRSGS